MNAGCAGLLCQADCDKGGKVNALLLAEGLVSTPCRPSRDQPSAPGMRLMHRDSNDMNKKTPHSHFIWNLECGSGQPSAVKLPSRSLCLMRSHDWQQIDCGNQKEPMKAKLHITWSWANLLVTLRQPEYHDLLEANPAGFLMKPTSLRPWCLPAAHCTRGDHCAAD